MDLDAFSCLLTYETSEVGSGHRGQHNYGSKIILRR